jgi:hypothetical protein
LQDWLYDPGSPAWYDYATWVIHLSHFLVSTTLLVVLWRLGSPLFRRLLVGLLVLSYAALVTYWAYPAVPPWLASDQGHLQEVTRVVHTVWADAGVAARTSAPVRRWRLGGRPSRPSATRWRRCPPARLRSPCCSR